MDWLSKLFNLGGGQGGQAVGNAASNAFQQAPINWGNVLGGLATSGIGQLIGNNASKKSIGNLENYQFGNRSNLSPEASQAIEYSLKPQEDQRRKKLQNVYANMQPGNNISTSTNYARDNNYLEQEIGQNRNAAYQGAITQLDNQRYGQLQDMANIGISRGNDWSSLFGGMGGALINRGINPNSIMEQFMAAQQQQNSPFRNQTSAQYLNQAPSNWQGFSNRLPIKKYYQGGGN